MAPPVTPDTMALFDYVLQAFVHSDKGVLPLLALGYWFINKKTQSVKDFNDRRFSDLKQSLAEEYKVVRNKLDYLEERMVTPQACALHRDAFEARVEAVVEPLVDRVDKVTNGGGLDRLAERVTRLETKVGGMGL